MKKVFILLVFLTTLLTLTLTQGVTVHAAVGDIPYDTYALGLNGYYVSTATAYEGTFILNGGFEKPQDLTIDSEDNVYVADTDNHRIYIYNPTTKASREIGTEILQSPTGVFVDKNMDIYVADSKLQEVIWFNQEGVVQKEYGRPDEPLFGTDSPYVPKKVLVDAMKNVYVISEGGSNGIIQMDQNGDFLGYYGINRVELSFSLYFKRLLMSEDQKAKYASLTPKPATNLAIDQKGLIYTATQNEYVTPIKKLNIEGINKLTGRMIPDPYYQDIYVDDHGMIYVISNNTDHYPSISVLDPTGNLIFAFGDRAPGSLKIGEFDNPAGIAVDHNGDIWVLDSTAGIIQVFAKTEFASMVLDALMAYDAGDYDQAKALYLEIIRQNAMFSIAHTNLGKIYEREGNYQQALQSYHISNNKGGYSDMFWEVRDNWIANNLLGTLILLVALYIAWKIFKHFQSRIIPYQRLKENIRKLKRFKLTKELGMLGRILKNPLDVVYEIKFRQSIRIRTAALLYVFFIFLNIMTDFFIKGYLFRSSTDSVILSFEILKWLLPLLLFGIANHLINSLQSGEGFYRDIFIGLIFALSPILLFKLPLDIVSNVLTYNEAFLYKLAYDIMYGWAILNVIIVLKEINNYKIGQLIVNIILTIFTMLMMIIIYLVINVLLSQMITFIQGIIQEVF